MRRQQRKGFIEVLIELPWRVSAALAVLNFIAFRWMIPRYLSQGPMNDGLRSIFPALSWVGLSAFGFIAFLAKGREMVQAENDEDKQVGSREANRLQTPNARTTAEYSLETPGAWSVEAIRLLEWKRFELLCAKYFEALGYDVQTTGSGADGGIDVKLYQNDPFVPVAFVQCKAWNHSQVGVKEIRELFGVMANGKVPHGAFVTTAKFTKAAVDFAAAHPIRLLDGERFAKKILELPAAKQQELLEFAFEGDYRTPTCASCGVKMVAREGRRGTFWGCAHYPRCKSVLRFQS